MSAATAEPQLDHFEVKLQSRIDKQRRFVSLMAPSPEVAREMAEKQEQALVDFSLLPPDKDRWEQGQYLADDGSGGVNVNLNNWDAYHPAFAEHAASLSYGEAVKAAERRLRDLKGRMVVDGKGKVRYKNLNGRHVARVMAHEQREPYEVADIIKVDPNEVEARRLVSQLKALHGQDPRKLPLIIQRLREEGFPVNAVTASLAGISVQKQMDGSNPWVWSSAAIQTSLHTAYTFDPDTHDFYNDASGTEITGTGYTALGVTLGSKTSTYDTATDQSRQDAADASWATSTLSATDAVIWVNTAGASSTDMILGNIDFGATVTTTAGTFLITFDATGIIVIDIT